MGQIASVLAPVLGAGYLARLYFSKLSHLPALKTSSTVLDISTTRFTAFDIVHIYYYIFKKSVTIPFLLQTPKLRPNDKGGFNLPELSISGPLTFDDTDLIAYLRAVTDDKLSPSDTTFDSSTQIPPLFFASVTQTLFALLLAHPLSPIKPVGSVNTVNTFETLRPDLVKNWESLKEGDWSAKAWMGGDELSGERKKRGIEWTMKVEITNAKVGEQGVVVWSGSFKAMAFLSRSHKPIYDPSTDKSKDPEPLPTSIPLSASSVEMSASAPYYWALATGDFNPIHISPFLAKNVFKLPSIISHGNLVVATLAHHLISSPSSLSPDEKQTGSIMQGEKAWYITLNFKRMVEVPTELGTRFSELRKGGGVRYELVKKDGKVATFGELGLL